MRRIIIFISLLLTTLLSGCIDKDISVEEYMENNPDIKDDLILNSEIPDLTFKLYSVSITREKKFIYEFEASQNIEIIYFNCNESSSNDEIYRLDLKDISHDTGFIPELSCESTIVIHYAVFEQDAIGTVGEFVN
jgi:hypothetical protein